MSFNISNKQGRIQGGGQGAMAPPKVGKGGAKVSYGPP